MKSILKISAAIVSAMGLVACGGGSGSGNYSTGGTYYTHSELANEFVRRVNVDVSGYDLELVKTNTLQTDYIVVYDWGYGTYDAYWLGNYNPGENMYNYLVANDQYFYYDLIPDGSNYRDYYTGYLFNKASARPADVSDLKTQVVMNALNDKAEEYRAEYGMSKVVATKIVGFAYNLKSNPGAYTEKDYDDFAKSVFGSTITEIQADYKAGNKVSLAERIVKAGEVSGMGAIGASALVQEVFFGN